MSGPSRPAPPNQGMANGLRGGLFADAKAALDCDASKGMDYERAL